MTALVVLLLFLFLNVYLSSHSRFFNAKSRFRTFVFASVLTMTLFLQLRTFIQPPAVDYYRIGWQGLIQSINRGFERKGLPYRLPDPGGQ